ncbi:MAG: hypothetical protein KGL38_12010 [Gemmatimonadota bacterium]|nr:hypothetical protein [Gemmatimonadota bacterium]
MKKTILQPAAARAVVPELAATRHPDVWVYRYQHDANGWTLSIATHAEPGSQKLSLGGFRIAPDERVQSPGFTTDHEAIGLAMGMEEKVHWSRVIHVGGPLTLRNITRICGGKCVLEPSPDARVGRPRDAQLLDWAVQCFRDVEAAGGFYLTTGQDLGHGVMSDGKTQSLAYLNAQYKGSVVADTSRPTGEGNYQLLKGMLRALDLDLAGATVGLIGAGHIGMYMIDRLREHGTTMLVAEARRDRRRELEAMGIRTWAPDTEREMMALPMDALVVNAAGGTLDRDAVSTICANPRVKVVCGSENLVMPDPADANRLRDAGKVYAPTELGGMMGYLTAAEEYLSHLAAQPFDVNVLLEAARRLDTAGYEATTRVRNGGFKESFEDAVVGLYGGVDG